MTKKRGQSRDAGLLGVHGLVFSSPDPDALASRWKKLTGLAPLRRSRREVVLGGPELFVIVRRGAKAAGDALEEVHVAVEEIGATGKKGSEDALGGDSWSRSAGSFDVVVRQFRRPPGRAWRRRRAAV
ncbi:MAG TPA: hypothetical protein VFF17_04235 [Thermoanaerobaculia bacterium]|nr:hypothetical protein [Thermoanaerobaculia bacterium]